MSTSVAAHSSAILSWISQLFSGRWAGSLAGRLNLLPSLFQSLKECYDRFRIGVGEDLR